jgi:hypothetical protein
MSTGPKVKKEGTYHKVWIVNTAEQGRIRNFYVDFPHLMAEEGGPTNIMPRC